MGAATEAERKTARIAALIVGVLLAPVVLEVVLQLGALFVGSTRSGGPGTALVLCQGDSNTYGFNLDAQFAFPAQLEALLREGGASKAVVVNRGVPGKPTWVVADELDEDLALHRPKAWVVLCGLNDRNMLRPDGATGRVLSKLRTIALLRRLISRGEEGAVDTWQPQEDEQPNILTHRSIERLGDDTERVHFEDRTDSRRPFVVHKGATEPNVYREWIAADLADCARRARDAGVVPLIVAYPLDTGPFAVVNEGVEQAAARAGARLVDPRPWFNSAIERLGRDELVFRDGHPTALGHSVIARLLWTALVEEGVVDGPALLDPLAGLAEWTPPELVVEPWLEADRVVGVRVRYRTGHRVQLMLAGARGTTPTRWRGVMHPIDDGEARFEIPLARDAVFEAAWRDTQRYLVTLDDAGFAEIRLAPDLVESTAPLWAIVVVVAPGSSIVEIDEPLELR